MDEATEIGERRTLRLIRHWKGTAKYRLSPVLKWKYRSANSMTGYRTKEISKVRMKGGDVYEICDELTVDVDTVVKGREYEINPKKFRDLVQRRLKIDYSFEKHDDLFDKVVDSDLTGSSLDGLLSDSGSGVIDELER